MKKIFTLIAFISIHCLSFAHDRIDPPKLKRNFNDTSYFNRTYNHFKVGWNWGGAGRKMDEALFFC